MNESPSSARRLAFARILLGTLQIMAATVTLVFFLRTGTSILSVAAGMTALALVVTSQILFRGRDKSCPNPGEE